MLTWDKSGMNACMSHKHRFFALMSRLMQRVKWFIDLGIPSGSDNTKRYTSIYLWGSGRTSKTGYVDIC